MRFFMVVGQVEIDDEEIVVVVVVEERVEMVGGLSPSSEDASSSRGRVKVNLEPLPSSLSTPIVPPMSSTWWDAWVG